MIHSARQLPRNGRIYIYGTGGRGRKLLAQVRTDRPDVTVLGFLDTFRESGEVDGVALVALDAAVAADPDRIVIAAYRYDQIMRRLADHGLADRALIFYDVNPPAIVPDPGQAMDREDVRALTSGWEQGQKNYPDQLNITLTTVCNCKCIFCAYQVSTDVPQTMDQATFERAVHGVLDAGMSVVDFSPIIGESLLDPGALDKMEAARNAGVQTIKMTTNGTRLNMGQERVAKLVELLDNISISTPGFNAEAYASVFRFKRYDDVIQGLEKLGQAKRDNPDGALVNLCLRSYRPFAEAFDDPDFLRLSPNLKDGSLFFDPGDGNVEFDNWSGVVGEDELLPGMDLKTVTVSPKAPPCRFLVHGNATLLPDGSVRLCPCRYLDTVHDELVIGNVNQAALADILFNERHQGLVQGWLDGRLPAPCRTCSLYCPPVRDRINP